MLVLKKTITTHRCGRLGFELFKVTGSAFTHFVRDEYTTLPERVDRPLFMALDVFWQYADPTPLADSQHAHYVPADGDWVTRATVSGRGTDSLRHSRSAGTLPCASARLALGL
ncbi:MAG TPA: hypothetical protein VKY19_28615 [Ktedonosporobacter sp.]|nr:hypothetical protein [Ktedonosporobacter sp.]